MKGAARLGVNTIGGDKAEAALRRTEMPLGDAMAEVADSFDVQALVLERQFENAALGR